MGTNWWKPCQDVCVLFDDKTGENRTSEELETMINEMQEVSNKYGFDLSAYGNDKSLYKMLKSRFKIAKEWKQI